jgi:SAM-dependent methyltransferase
MNPLAPYLAAGVTWHSTAADRDFRPPYQAEFFAEAARRLRLSGREDLLDLGCGLGAVALGMAPYVGTLTALDPEAPALEILQQRAAASGRAVRVVHATVEAADPGLGRFDAITIGKAYWYMEPAVATQRIDAWLKPRGRVLICTPNELAGKSEPDAELWRRTLSLLVERWSVAPTDPRQVEAEEFLRGDFAVADRFDVYGEQTIDLEHMVRRALAMPSTSRTVLGDNAGRFAADVRRVMGHFFRNGVLTERLQTTGIVFARKSEM